MKNIFVTERQATENYTDMPEGSRQQASLYGYIRLPGAIIDVFRQKDQYEVPYTAWLSS